MNTFHLHRDLRETRQRFDSVGSEIKRKDNQIRELQQRLEVNEGCKFHFHFNHSQINHSVFSFLFQFKNISIHLFLKQRNIFFSFRFFPSQFVVSLVTIKINFILQTVCI